MDQDAKNVKATTYVQNQTFSIYFHLNCVQYADR